MLPSVDAIDIERAVDPSETQVSPPFLEIDGPEKPPEGRYFDLVMRKKSLPFPEAYLVRQSGKNARR
jgi:hypothetical protein